MTSHLLRAAAAALLVAALSACRAPAPPASTAHGDSGHFADVLTHRGDVSRTGSAVTETTLAVANVDARRFGLVASRSVDGDIFTQPLFAGALAVGGATRDVVFVATEHDSVYAFDAGASDDTPLWHVSLGTPVLAGDIAPDCADLGAEVGITSTPVIDRAAGTMYVVAKTHGDDGDAHHWLHALALADGKERAGSPVEIAATVAGAGAFASLKQLNRAALLLSGGAVYIAFSGHCDLAPFHGWLFAYDAKTLRRRGVFVDTPNGSDGGIWQSGHGPAADAEGNVYLVSGNGTFDATDYGNSFLKLRLDGSGLAVSDWFTPHDEQYLSDSDLDLGSGGPVLLPGDLVAGGGKAGVLYLLDAAHLGHHHDGDDAQALARFPASTGEIIGAPLYLHSDAGDRLFVWSAGDRLKAYALDGRTLDARPVDAAALPATSGWPGGALTVSSDGGRRGSMIVWASRPDGDGTGGSTPSGIVQAFDADALGHELWNSEQYADRDHVAAYAKFAPPTVANGKLFVATRANALLVYGTLPPLPSLPGAWLDGDIGAVDLPGETELAAGGDFIVRGAGSDIWGFADAFHFVYQPWRGDFVLVARVDSFAAADPWAKAALVVRGTLDPATPFVAVDVTAANGVVMQARDGSSAGYTSAMASPGGAPLWLELERRGDTFTASRSVDGTSWQVVDTHAQPIADPLYVGLAVTSHDQSRAAAARFSHVTLEAGGR